MNKPSKSKEARISQKKWDNFINAVFIDITLRGVVKLKGIKFDNEGNMVREGKAYAYALKHFPHLLEKYEGNK